MELRLGAEEGSWEEEVCNRHGEDFSGTENICAKTLGQGSAPMKAVLKETCEA